MNEGKGFKFNFSLASSSDSFNAHIWWAYRCYIVRDKEITTPEAGREQKGSYHNTLSESPP